MLIVKGKAQKSVLANILMDKTNSICFQYYDMPVIRDSICVDKSECSLNDFIECISDEFEFMRKDDTHYDYAIIYTNENKEDLKELIDWLNNNRWKIRCNDIIMMCKE